MQSQLILPAGRYYSQPHLADEDTEVGEKLAEGHPGLSDRQYSLFLWSSSFCKTCRLQKNISRAALVAKTWHTRDAKFTGDTDNAVRGHKDPPNLHTEHSISTHLSMAHNHCCCLWRVNGAWLGSEGRRGRAGIPPGPLPPPSASTAHGHTMAPAWNSVEPTPEGWVALLRPHTWGCWTLGSLRLGMKAAGALRANVSSLAGHVHVSRTP